MPFGPGPVFTFECLKIPRRWQLFAGRSVFVAMLLVGLWVIWAPSGHVYSNFADLAFINQRFFSILIITQLVVVMLAAPALAAGAICVDKSRGTLQHVFTTDLSAREIVLGKLGAHLASVIMLMTSSLPVLAISGLLGGVDTRSVVNAYAVTAAVALAACSLAMTFSVWVRKPQHALLPTYLLMAAWCVLYPILRKVGFGSIFVPWLSPTEWDLGLVNPFVLVLAPVEAPMAWDWGMPISFVLISCVFSASVLLVSIRHIRRVVIEQESRKRKLIRADAPFRLLDYLPGPSLDANPIFWREWHRKKPTRWTGRFWMIYGLLSFLASAFALLANYTNPGGIGPPELAGFVNGWSVALGLLMLSVSATTSLAEERDRGSLDVILTTPLSTATILRGKWLGTFAMVPRLVIMPMWVSLGITMVTGQYLAPVAMLGLILAYSALVTTMGLAIATWVPQLGRAIAVGLMTCILMGVSPGVIPWITHSRSGLEWVRIGNPWQGVFETSLWAAQLQGRNYGNWTYYFGETVNSYASVATWIVILAGLSVWLMMVTISTFDRLLNRMTTDIRLNRPQSRAPVGVTLPPSPQLP